MVVQWSRPVAGFTYLGVLFLVALMGVALAATGVVWHAAQQREKEVELLFVGDQFRRAIGQYYEKTPGGAKQYPKSLDDLLLDKRVLTVQRHLRKVFYDPITRSNDWGLVMSGDRVVGVYSRSEDEPMKKANFPLADAAFEGKKKYADWQFNYKPQPAQTPQGINPAPGVVPLPAKP